MNFGDATSHGHPFYLNNNLAGWVCTTINGQFTYLMTIAGVDKQKAYDTRIEAELALMAVFGE